MSDSILSTIMSYAVGGVIAFAGWNYLLDNQSNICKARTEFIAKQAPYAFQIEKVRHPLTIGVGLGLFDKQDEVLKSFQTAIRSTASSDGAMTCAYQTAVMHIWPDQTRTALADELDKAFGLAGLP